MIRSATADDLDALADLETLCLGREAWSRAVLADELAADRLLRVAVEDGVVVGYVDVSVVDDVAELLRVAVAPAARRGGVGSRLVEDVAAASRAAGAERMLLEVASVNEPARSLYAASGFEQISRRRHYYRDGDDALVLQRTLVEAR